MFEMQSWILGWGIHFHFYGNFKLDNCDTPVDLGVFFWQTCIWYLLKWIEMHFIARMLKTLLTLLDSSNHLIIMRVFFWLHTLTWREFHCNFWLLGRCPAVLADVRWLNMSEHFPCLTQILKNDQNLWELSWLRHISPYCHCKQTG